MSETTTTTTADGEELEWLDISDQLSKVIYGATFQALFDRGVLKMVTHMIADEHGGAPEQLIVVFANNTVISAVRFDGTDTDNPKIGALEYNEILGAIQEFVGRGCIITRSDEPETKQ